MAITVAPLTTTVMNAVDQRASGTASGINNALSRTAGLIAIAGLGIVMVAVFSHSLDQQLILQHLPADIPRAIGAQSSKLAGIELPHTLNEQTRTLLKGTIDQSFVTGFRVIMLTCAGLALASAIAAGILVEKKQALSPQVASSP